MTKRGAALKQISDAGAPLYQSLNDAQKARFTMLARILRPHEHRHAMNDGGQNGQGWGHRHFGQNGQDRPRTARAGVAATSVRMTRAMAKATVKAGRHRHFGQNGHGGMRNMSNDDQDSKL